MTLAEYRACLAIARRHARNSGEAADLLHEALLAGVQVGRFEFSSSADRAWLAGTIRHIAAETVDTPPPGDGRDEILARLTEGTRRIAVLALHGMNADEIQYVLELKPPAFRQRLSALRRALGDLPEPLRQEALALAYSQPRRAGGTRLDFGLIRRALLHHLRGGAGVGTHDPDGHLLAIRAP